MRRYSFGLALAVAAAAALGGCDALSPERSERYELRGSVVSVDKERQRVVLAHEEVPGYMPAMTMPFRVKDRWVVDALEPGRQVQADLVVAGGGSWIENVTITTATGEPSAPSMIEGSVEPTQGAPAPPVDLVDHEARRISLADFEGKAVVLTFIYTRCPVPDYCPLMTENFAVAEREMRGDPRLAGSVQLISVSIDPEFDTPEVMREYARRVAGDERGAIPRNWTFATGSPDEVRKVAQSYGLVYESANGEVVHTLRTALIAPDGSLHRIYRGNEWKPADLLADLAALTLPSPPASAKN